MTMFKLPKKMLFAIEAVIDIAYNAGGSPVQNNEITKRLGIPKRYLEQVLLAFFRFARGLVYFADSPFANWRLFFRMPDS